MPFCEHLQSFFEVLLADGLEPLVLDGQIYLTEDPEQGIVIEEENGKKRVVKLSESDDEWIHRMFEEDLNE